MKSTFILKLKNGQTFKAVGCFAGSWSTLKNKEWKTREGAEKFKTTFGNKFFNVAELMTVVEVVPEEGAIHD